MSSIAGAMRRRDVQIAQVSRLILEYRNRHRSSHNEQVVPMDDLVALFGEKKALQFAVRWAGRKVPSPWAWLVQLRKDAVIADFKAGMPVEHIAGRYALSKGRVENIVRPYRPEKVLKDSRTDIERLH